MLAHLRVRELVLIENLDLELSNGFNAMTGETGAGKSLVVTALDLLLGRRARTNLVRKGSKEATIEGVFDVTDEPAVNARLEDAGFPVDDELLVRRVIPAQGRHRCYVNGKLASLGVLSSLAEGLASIMGQHEHHSLTESSNQLDMLDGFGGHSGQIEKMASAYRTLHETEKEYSSLKDKEHDRAGKLDYIEFQIEEIDSIAPVAGELDDIDREIDLLVHQGVLLDTARRGAHELYESDGSIFERIGALGNALDNVTRYDESLIQDAKQLSEAAVLIEDAARSLSRYGQALEADPKRLEQLQDRREALRKLTMKHRTDLAGVLALRDSLESEKDTLSRYEDSLSKVRQLLDERIKEANERAAALTSSRQKAASKMSLAVSRELVDLSFENATFEIALARTDKGPTASGWDRVEFLVTLNPGEGAYPLRTVASGGELSRMMLALKRVLAGVGPVGTYVFDEVDAGIGGAVANAVGRKLAEVAKHHQVICITHLPQISAMADAHFKVSKIENEGRTTTRVDRIESKDRVEEISRMLGGEVVTPKIRAAAKELIGSAIKGQ